MYGSGPAGLPPIGMQSVVFRTPITLADAFCRTGVNAKPRWIGDEPLPLIDGVLVWFDHGTETRLFETTEPPPFGASFAIRRRLFEKIGLFRVDLGHRRNRAWGGARKLSS